MKLRHFYRIDHNTKQPIPGSNLKRKSLPGRFWKEILDICCDPQTIPCTCGPRFFVQIDAQKKPVPGTLIKRFNWPIMEQGIRYAELRWKSFCCDEITWNFDISGSTGGLNITVNGNPKVNTFITEEGSFKPNPGDTIEITVDNDGLSPINIISVGGVIVISEDEASSTYSFVWDGKQTHISVAINNSGD